MVTAYLLIYIPILLFVVAFLYETYLSAMRLFSPKRQRKGYVDITWEVTHTLLVFGVVMMLMLFTKNIDEIAAVIFWPTFIAMSALFVRGACYIYLFYVSKPSANASWIDWVFMLSHLVAAFALVAVVVSYTWYLWANQPVANLQFIPSFLVGLSVILAITAGPLLYLYFGKHRA